MFYKNIIIWSNCQGEGIKIFLSKINAFKESNIIVLKNYQYIEEKKPIPIDYFNYADLFIYQPLNKKHQEYSDENIIPLVPKTCIKISIPYIYNNALWAFGSGCMGPIEQLKQKGYSCDEVISLYLNNKIDYEFDKRMENTLNILRQKEKNTDIKVTDYIEQNISEKKLFIIGNHPTSTVFIHCVNQILNKLNINEKLDDKDYGDNILDIFGKWVPFIIPISINEIRHYKFKYITEGYEVTIPYHIDCIRKCYDNSYKSNLIF